MENQILIRNQWLLTLSVSIVFILAISLLVHLMLAVSFFSVPFAPSDLSLVSSEDSSSSLSARSLSFISRNTFSLILPIVLSLRVFRFVLVNGFFDFSYSFRCTFQLLNFRRFVTKF